VVGVSKTKRRKGKGKAGQVQLQPRAGVTTPGTSSPWGTRPGRHPVVQLDGGEVGYCMDPARTDDCFQAAIATAVQVPIEQVPDLRLDRRVAAGDDPEEINRESWVRLEAWLLGRGLRIVVHETVPVERDRWAGVCLGRPDAEAGLRDGYGEFVWRDNPFRDHCLVMTHGDVFFDPAVSVPCPPGKTWRRWYCPTSVTDLVSIEWRTDLPNGAIRPRGRGQRSTGRSQRTDP
jgi:hypothetical protein